MLRLLFCSLLACHFTAASAGELTQGGPKSKYVPQLIYRPLFKPWVLAAGPAILAAGSLPYFWSYGHTDLGYDQATQNKATFWSAAVTGACLTPLVIEAFRLLTVVTAAVGTGPAVAWTPKSAHAKKND